VHIVRPPTFDSGIDHLEESLRVLQDQWNDLYQLEPRELNAWDAATEGDAAGWAEA